MPRNRKSDYRGGFLFAKYLRGEKPTWIPGSFLHARANSTPPGYLAYLRAESIPYLVAGKERVDLRLTLEKMKSQLGVTSVMSTSLGTWRSTSAGWAGR